MNKERFRKQRLRMAEFLAEKAIFSIALFSLACIVLIFVFVFREASALFFDRHSTAAASSMEQQETYGDEGLESPLPSEELAQKEEPVRFRDLWRTVWQPVSLHPRYGIWPLLAGSFKVTLIAILFGAPIAVFAALFTMAFAPRWSREILKPSIEILSGFPSVVIGFFALVVMATFLQKTFGLEYRLNAFVGGLALSLAVIPIIYTITEDSLSAIPKSLSEAGLALGAHKWETVLFVVLPAATPGIFAAVLLGFGRAFGETMIVLMATGNAALLSFDLFEPVRTMSATIGAEMAEVVFGDTHYSVLFMIGAILFVISFGLNAIAELYVRQRLMKRFKGG